jgi:hypothetical protein
MNTSSAWRVIVVFAAVLLGVTTLNTSTSAVQEKQDFTVDGEYVEGCSCMGVCPCELTGVKSGCQGVGALKLTSGSYMGTDLSDVKIAYATLPGTWVRLYVDASDAQRPAAEAFGKAVYAPFGKIEAVKPAKIAFEGEDGKYTVSVDGGRTMQLSTVPVMGGDNKTPIAHSNTKDLLNPTFLQGKTVSARYHDGRHSFTLKDTNSYFNNQMHSSGKV